MNFYLQIYVHLLTGNVFANPISGLILDRWHSWPIVFYVFGILGVVWFLAFVVLCYNNPREHPFISEREAKYLHDKMSAHTHEKTPPVPWRYVLTSAPLWALVAAQCGHDWCLFTMITDLPKFMKDVMHFDIKQNGIYTSLPYLFMWICSCISSWLADWVIVRNYMTTTQVRKWGTTIASLGPAIFIIIAGYASHSQVAVVIYITVGMTFMGFFYPGKIFLYCITKKYKFYLTHSVNDNFIVIWLSPGKILFLMCGDRPN